MTATTSPLRADIDLEAPGKRIGHVRLLHSTHESAYGWIPIPIAVIRGGDGPTVLLTAGNHGDEYEGQVALLKLIRALEPGDVRGRVVVLPRLNLPAAAAGRRTSPIDGGNLNRVFPGDPEGTVTEQIACYVATVLIPLAQASLDIHSGGSSLEYLPCAYARVPEDAAMRARQRAALAAFGAPLAIMVETPLTGRSLSATALAAGHLSFSTEIGGGGTTRPASQAVADDGVRRFLAHLGVIANAPPATATPRLMRVKGAEHYVYTPVRGLFEPAFALGDAVRRGDLAGHVHHAEEPEREPRALHFAGDGIVVCRRVPSLVAPGDCLAHLASDM